MIIHNSEVTNKIASEGGAVYAYDNSDITFKGSSTIQFDSNSAILSDPNGDTNGMGEAIFMA